MMQLLNHHRTRSSRSVLAPMFVLLAWALVVQADDARSSVLLLKNGTVAEGEIQKISTGYLVKKPRGKFLVPFDQVRFEATSLKAAYDKQRARPYQPNEKDHLDLALWVSPINFTKKQDGNSPLRSS